MDLEKDEPVEPPSRASSGVPPVLIGRNSRGQWVAQDQRGLFGGLFVDCKKALRFARDEIGRGPQSIVIVSGVLELDISRRPATASAVALAHVA